MKNENIYSVKARPYIQAASKPITLIDTEPAKSLPTRRLNSHYCQTNADVNGPNKSRLQNQTWIRVNQLIHFRLKKGKQLNGPWVCCV